MSKFLHSCWKCGTSYKDHPQEFECDRPIDKPTFAVGDTVSVFGVEGKVVSVSVGDGFVYVKFDGVPFEHAFFLDGKQYNWHREPSLKLVSRPKKKVVKTIERWVNISSQGPDAAVHEKEEYAQAWKVKGCIATVKLTGSYETEEE